MKKVSCLLFIVLFSCNAYAVSGWVTTQNGQQIYFTSTNEDCIGCQFNVSVQISNNISGDLIIPDYVTRSGVTYTVTRISGRGNYCSVNTGLTSVTISSTIRYIEDRAFHKCTGLTTV